MRKFLVYLCAAVWLGGGTACNDDASTEYGSDGAVTLFPMEVALGTRGAGYFENGDRMGLVVDAQYFSCWTYADGWTAENGVGWPDMVNEHSFAAYFPYAVAYSSSAIPVPALGEQAGDEASMKRCDFVAAVHPMVYEADTKGRVDFTGDYALQHKLALLQLTLCHVYDLEGATVDRLVWRAKGLTSAGTYSFEADSLTYAGDEADTLNSLPGQTMQDDLTLYYVCNPLGEHTFLTLELHFTTADGRARMSTVQLRDCTLAPGQRLAFDLTVKHESIALADVTTADWNEAEDLGIVTF
jgi:hypothetical protein